MSEQIDDYVKKRLIITENGHRFWVDRAPLKATCPRCEHEFYAGDAQSFVNRAYEHFIDAHVVGGSFD